MISLRKAVLTICFVVFLYPVSVDGLSVNYSFALLPILSFLLRGKGPRPDDSVVLIMGLFVFVLVVAFLYQLTWISEGTRRLISFAIFMTLFAYMFMRMDAVMIQAFKLAVVGISLYFSLRSMHLLFAAGPDIGFEAKDLVGSQRFGFVYLMAFWLVYLEEAWKSIYRVAKYMVLLVLAAGVLLTFSRASLVSLLVTVGLFTVKRYWEWLKRPNVRGVLRLVASAAGAAALVVALDQLVPLAFRFFEERLGSLLFDLDAVAAELHDPRESPGTRALLATEMLEFVTHHPFTGSGYLGVWILPDVPAGSAHNQYLDVLFRTGFIGLAVYGYLLFRLVKYLAKQEQALFWGFVGVLVYGVFHETFKESQGAFVLAFLLGMLAQSGRDAKIRRRMMREDRGYARTP